MKPLGCVKGHSLQESLLNLLYGTIFRGSSSTLNMNPSKFQWQLLYGDHLSGYLIGYVSKPKPFNSSSSNIKKCFVTRKNFQVIGVHSKLPTKKGVEFLQTQPTPTNQDPALHDHDLYKSGRIFRHATHAPPKWGFSKGNGYFRKIHVGDILQFGLIWCIYGEHIGFLWVLYGSISICSIRDSQRHFLCEHAPFRINPFSWRDCRSWLKLLVLFGCFRTCIPKYSWKNHHPWRCAGRHHQGTRRLAEHTLKTREIRCAILHPVYILLYYDYIITESGLLFESAWQTWIVLEQFGTIASRIWDSLLQARLFHNIWLTDGACKMFLCDGDGRPGNTCTNDNVHFQFDVLSPSYPCFSSLERLSSPHSAWCDVCLARWFVEDWDREWRVG